MAEITLTINHAAGLHARPLAQFVKTVRQFESTVEVTNLTRGAGPARGDSALKLMLLAIKQGQEIQISAEGSDADATLDTLKSLIENDFEM